MSKWAIYVFHVGVLGFILVMFLNSLDIPFCLKGDFRAQTQLEYAFFRVWSQQPGVVYSITMLVHKKT